MPADRLLPSPEAADLVATMRGFAQARLAPVVDDHESHGLFPKDLLLEAADLGLMRMPYAPALGGGGWPYEVALQALEEVAGVWMAFAVAASVHSMTCWAMSEYAGHDQREGLLKPMLTGGLLGAYALSEPEAGSDAASLTTRAERDGDSWVISGQKMWIGPHDLADYYITFARTGAGRSDISAFYVPRDAAGLSFSEPLPKMGMLVTPLGVITYQGVRVPAGHLIGVEGRGLHYALAGLDRGRLSIAAIAIGVAQAALDYAVDFCTKRRQFGRPVADFQGLQFMFADMAAAIASGRAAYLLAARKLDAGRPFGPDAAVAKLVCTDNAMRVCTDAVQALGGQGFTRNHPVERYFRDVKVTQIFEGTNQIQRIVIARSLLAGPKQA